VKIKHSPQQSGPAMV